MEQFWYVRVGYHRSRRFSAVPETLGELEYGLEQARYHGSLRRDGNQRLYADRILICFAAAQIPAGGGIPVCGFWCWGRRPVAAIPNGIAFARHAACFGRVTKG